MLVVMLIMVRGDDDGDYECDGDVDVEWHRLWEPGQGPVTMHMVLVIFLKHESE